MQNWLRVPMTATAVVIAALVLTLISIVGQAPAYSASLTAEGKRNLNGIWQAVNTANWDLEAHSAQMAAYPELVGVYLAQPGGLSVVEGGTIPYKPEALAKKKDSFQKRLAVDPFNRDQGDPEAKCFMPGVPRATYMPFPFQIVQGSD